MVLVLTLCYSPRHNSNLLSRAEVVALINTLHRLSESLYYVNDFRKMWAETDKLEEERLIQGVNKLVADDSSIKVCSLSACVIALEYCANLCLPT